MSASRFLQIVFALCILTVSPPAFCAEDDEFLEQAEEEEKIRKSGLSEEDVELAKQYREIVSLLGVYRSRVLMHALMTDEELWDWLPHAIDGKTLPRVGPGHDYQRGCPIHGKYSGDPRCGWKWSPERPYKVRCATGDEWLPTNDYGAYAKAGMKTKLDCRQKYVDDGYGCIVGGKRYWCAAAANYFLYSYIIHLRRDLTECWEKSGNGVFLRKAMIVWASIAKDYPLMDYLRQNVGAHPRWWLGKMTFFGQDDPKLADYFNDRKMWEAVADDEKLKRFLKSKRIEGDLKEYIFKNIMLELYDACYTKNLFLSQGISGKNLQYIVQRWDNDDPELGPTSAALAKQAEGALWRHFYNDVYRDGVNTEISAAYGMMGQRQAAALVADRIKQDQPFPKTARLHNILCGSIRLVVIDKFIPAIGDAPFRPYAPDKGHGSAMTGALAAGGKGPGEPPGFQLGWELFNDKAAGKWLHQVGRMGKHAEQITKLVEKEGDDIALGSRVMTAYGLGILESGERGNRRAVTMSWMPDGCGSHAHSDMLNIELFAFGRTLAPDLGYPEKTGTWPKRLAWTAATVSHSTVVVNRGWSRRVFGTLNCFKTLPGFHTLDVSSEPSVFGGARPPARIFRRQLTLVDVGKDRFYVLDVFRVKGGSQHDWIFHANHKEQPGIDDGPDLPATVPGPDAEEEPAGERDEAAKIMEEDEPEQTKPEKKEVPRYFNRRALAEADGLDLSDPTKWKLLSDYQNGIKKPFRGTQYMHFPQLAKPDGQWNVTWDTGDDVNVRLTMLKDCAREVILTDGEPPYCKGAPKFLKYVLARNEGPELQSRYVGILEAYKGAPTVESVTDLRAKDDSWSDVAVRIEVDGRADFLFSSLAPEMLHSYPPAIRFRGSQAFLSQQEGQLAAACLIGDPGAGEVSPILETPRIRVEIMGTLSGTVTKIEPEAGTFETEADCIHPGLVGEIMVLGNAAHKCAYRAIGLRELGDGKWRVQLEADLIVGLSPVKKIEGRTAHLAERITTYNGRFAGMTLSNEDGRSLWAIAQSSMTSVTVSKDGPALDDDAIRDIDGDLARCLTVCDFGPGDEWHIPASAHVTRSGDEYVIRTIAPTKVTLPKGTRLRIARPDGRTAPVAASAAAAGRNTFEIRPGGGK